MQIMPAALFQWSRPARARSARSHVRRQAGRDELFDQDLLPHDGDDPGTCESGPKADQPQQLADDALVGLGLTTRDDPPVSKPRQGRP